MPRKPVVTKKRENRKKFAGLVREGIERLSVPAAAVAERAGLTRTHLYHVLSETKSLRREKVMALADVLKIPRERLLEAAGYSAGDDSDIDLSKVTLVRSFGGPTLRVVTDPRFVDSALFYWILGTQPFRKIDIECEVIQTDWSKVPQEVAKSRSIGFYNRKAVITLRGQVLHPVRYWSDLCLYKGYALMCRPGTLQPPVSLGTAQAYIRGLVPRHGHPKPVIVSMGADTVWRLNTPFTPELNEKNFQIAPIDNPDLALNRFLNGLGDLFAGGLPQRIAAQEQGCVSLLSFDNNPLLFSFNSLICSEDMVADEQKPILSAVSALWFGTIAKMKTDGMFRRRAARAAIQALEASRISDHHLSEQLFDRILASDDLESFPDQPTGLVDAFVDIADRVLRLFGTGEIPVSALDGVCEALREPLKPELDRETHPVLV